MDAGNRRREDSGVIDIDELMRQANLGESATASSNEEAPKTSRKSSEPSEEIEREPIRLGDW